METKLKEKQKQSNRKLGAQIKVETKNISKDKNEDIKRETDRAENSRWQTKKTK